MTSTTNTNIQSFNGRDDTLSVRLVDVVSFVFGFLDALFLYVLSSYFARIAGSDNIGGFYVASYLIVFLTIPFFQPLVRKIGKVHTLLLFLGLSIIFTTLASSLGEVWLGAVAAVFFLAFSNLGWVALDILLESFSKDQTSGQIRGTLISLVHVAFIIAALLSTHIIAVSSFSTLFTALVFGYSILLVLVLLFFRNYNSSQFPDIRFSSTFRRFLEETDLRRIFLVSLSLEFFYALMIIFTPLVLLVQGFTFDDMGILFTVMLLPFVFLSYLYGWLADRRYGEKELLLFSIVVVCSATILIAFTQSNNLLVWMALLFATRIGASGMEVMRDTYFFKHINGDDADVIALFRISRPLANVIAGGLSTLLLLFAPIEGVFVLIAAVLFLALFPAMNITDTLDAKKTEIEPR